MKKIILACALSISCISIAQIKIIETTPVIKLGVIGQNDAYIKSEANEVTVVYKNAEDEQGAKYVSFSFKDLDDDYKNLHKIILKGFESDPLLDVKLELPNNFVWLHYSKELGDVYVQFVTTKKDVFNNTFSRKFSVVEINKLFNKNLPKKIDVKEVNTSEFKS
jgi:hypothetical protein